MIKESPGIDLVMTGRGYNANAKSQFNHKIMGRKVLCTKAEVKVSKIYLGLDNLPTVSKEEIGTHFSIFVTVTKVERPVSGKTRGRRRPCSC